MHKTYNHRNGFLRRSAKVVTGIVLIATQWVADPSGAQVRRQTEPRVEKPTWESNPIQQAVSMICEERVRDRQGTVPIDEMAMQRALPITDPQVTAGKERAQRLLPVAKSLVPSILNRLAMVYQSKAVSRERVVARLGLISTIKPDIEQHDNATVQAQEPKAIVFGTVFLAGLRSDEAMIAVLAHELTHVIDGPDHILQPLFERVAIRASELSEVRIPIRPAIELTCELVGIHVMQDYLGGGTSSDNKVRRMARAFQKDCVRHDLADDTHLSPRETLRMLLMLEPGLTRTIARAERTGQEPRDPTIPLSAPPLHNGVSYGEPTSIKHP